MSGGESDVSDDSSDFERSPFRHLRRYLRCPLGTDSNETRDHPIFDPAETLLQLSSMSNRQTLGFLVK
jgi:hypothetical protein